MLCRMLRRKPTWSRAGVSWPPGPPIFYKGKLGHRIGNDKSEGSDAMHGQQINRVSGKVLIVLSLTALLAVLSGYAQPPQLDEGTAAHIFQLSIVALVPMIFLFLATADWRQLCEVHGNYGFQPPLWCSRLERCITLSTTD